jgi:hypothetical protein
MDSAPAGTYFRWAMRGQRGQTAAETMGVLLLISGIIFLLATSDTPAKIANRTKELVCQIGGESNCGASATTNGPNQPGDGGPDDGPSLADHGPFPILPFPGFASVTCAGDTRSAGNNSCVPDGRTGVGVNASDEKKIERTPTTLDANGCPWQTASVATTLKLGVTGEVKNPTASGSLSGYLGHQSKYQITTSPGAMDDIADGRRDPPNPVDPRTINNGESVQMTEEWYAGASAKASYRALQVEMGYDKGRRVSSGVKKISPTTVRVYVGDEDFVRQALKLGVDIKALNLALGNTKDLSDGKLKSVDIDISNQDGWNAYQEFLNTGHMPKTGAKGTSNPTHAETLHYSDTTTIQAKLGGIQFGGQVNSSDGRVTTTHNPDGTIDNISTARIGDTEIAITQHQDGNGNDLTAPTRSLLLHDVDPSLIDGLYQLSGSKPPSDLGHDVRVDFSEPQLQELQNRALSSLADKIAMNGKRPTLQEIQDSLRANHGTRVDYNGVQYAFDGQLMEMGAAANPNDILIALYHGGLSSGAVLQSLLDLGLTGHRDLPGTIHQPSC